MVFISKSFGVRLGKGKFRDESISKILKVFSLIFCSRDQGVRRSLDVKAGVKSIISKEGRHLGGGMNSVIIRELSKW